MECITTYLGDSTSIFTPGSGAMSPGKARRHPVVSNHIQKICVKVPLAQLQTTSANNSRSLPPLLRLNRPFRYFFFFRSVHFCTQPKKPLQSSYFWDLETDFFEFQVLSNFITATAKHLNEESSDSLFSIVQLLVGALTFMFQSASCSPALLFGTSPPSVPPSTGYENNLLATPSTLFGTSSSLGFFFLVISLF